MRTTLAVLVLALLVVGCGGGGQASAPGGPTSATTLDAFDANQLAAYERAVFDTLGTAGTTAERQAAIDGATTAGLVAIDSPDATYQSVVSGVRWTARDLLRWVSIYGNPAPANAAQDALDTLP